MLLEKNERLLNLIFRFSSSSFFGSSEKKPLLHLFVCVKGNKTIYLRLAGLVVEIICGQRALSITGPGKLSACCGMDSLIKGGNWYERHFGLFPGNVILWLTPEGKHFNYSYK